MKRILLIVTGILLIAVLEARAQQFPVNCPTAALAYTSATHKYTCNTGPLLMADGNVSAPTYAYSNATNGSNTGIWYSTNGNLNFSSQGIQIAKMNAGESAFQIGSTIALSWGTNFSGQDLLIFRDIANTLAQRNGTNAQTFRIYNTFTDASNYERGSLVWNSNIFSINADEAAGTGSQRQLQLRGTRVLLGTTNIGSNSWQIETTGDFLAVTDNTYDIGASGATRPRTGYFGTSVVSSAYNTTTNCSSSASPAVCAAAPAGSVTITAGATTVTVNTTAVTANSQIMITEDSSLGTKLSVTCNTTLARNYAITARTAATSFVITTDVAPVTNPACISYVIIN